MESFQYLKFISLVEGVNDGTEFISQLAKMGRGQKREKATERGNLKKTGT